MPCCVVQDVPAALNGLLDSLPAKISIQGLPFDAVFTYALYTLNYVIVKVRHMQAFHLCLWQFTNIRLRFGCSVPDEGIFMSGSVA